MRSWQSGTVIRSWLLDLGVAALDADPGLSKIRGYAADSGEGRWTVEAAIDNAVPLPVITRRPVRAVRLAPGRLAGDEDGRCVAQPVRWPRGRGGAVHGRRGERPVRVRPRRAISPPRRTTRRELYLRHLSVADFRSWASADVAFEPGGVGAGRCERQRQDQPARGRRIPVDAGQSSRRLRCAADPGRLSAGRHRRCGGVGRARTGASRVELTAGKANKARLNRAPLPAGPRFARRGAFGAVRAGGSGRRAR